MILFRRYINYLRLQKVAIIRKQSTPKLSLSMLLSSFASRSNMSLLACVILLIFVLTSCAPGTATSRAAEIAEELKLEKWDCVPSGQDDVWSCAPQDTIDESKPTIVPEHSLDQDTVEEEPEEVAAISVVDVSVPVSAPDLAPIDSVPDTPREYQWLMLDAEANLDFVRSLPVSFFIVQVAAFRTFEHALKFQETHPDFEFRSVKVNSRNGVFHVMLLGAHPTYSSAVREVQSISAEIKNLRPWIRTVESLIQSLE